MSLLEDIDWHSASIRCTWRWTATFRLPVLDLPVSQALVYVVSLFLLLFCVDAGNRRPSRVSLDHTRSDLHQLLLTRYILKETVHGWLVGWGLTAASA